ncbi:MAG: MgtC/SapB family protein [Deltaproteobacteria bacterium]|nr:MgtC/SapB family protein [Deltaproteobacteria bacterium]
MECIFHFFAINGTAFLRLAVAFILGGAIGLERSIHGRPAGLRTHLLVCVGATLIMVASNLESEFYQQLSSGHRITIDPGRIVAGIMTGIGFLGAGAIIKTGDLVRGLTTAACIWFVAALGIVIGQGYYSLAVVSTLAVLLSLILLQYLERKLPSLVYHTVNVITSPEQADRVEEHCLALFKKENVQIKNRSHSIFHDTGRFEITFDVSMRERIKSGTVIRSLAKIPGIIQAKWH